MNNSTFETTRRTINKSNFELMKYQQNGLYSYILNKNRAKEKFKSQLQSNSPTKQSRPQTAIIDFNKKSKLNFKCDNYATIQLGNAYSKHKEETDKIRNPSSSTPHQQLFVNDYRIARAMSTLKKLKKQRQFLPCPFTLGINIEQCNIKPKVLKQKSFSQIQQGLNKSEILRVKKLECPISTQKSCKFMQPSKWEQYDDTNLFDLNFLNNNLFKYEF